MGDPFEGMEPITEYIPAEQFDWLLDFLNEEDPPILRNAELDALEAEDDPETEDCD